MSGSKRNTCVDGFLAASSAFSVKLTSVWAPKFSRGGQTKVLTPIRNSSSGQEKTEVPRPAAKGNRRSFDSPFDFAQGSLRMTVLWQVKGRNKPAK
ncbi:MAG: hypothetical protein WCE75_11150 [Terracidiphilus sp.]